jgi:hypothetical protein
MHLYVQNVSYIQVTGLVRRLCILFSAMREFEKRIFCKGGIVFDDFVNPFFSVSAAFLYSAGIVSSSGMWQG